MNAAVCGNDLSRLLHEAEDAPVTLREFTVPAFDVPPQQIHQQRHGAATSVAGPTGRCGILPSVAAAFVCRLNVLAGHVLLRETSAAVDTRVAPTKTVDAVV